MNEIMIFEDADFGQVRTIMSASNEPLFCLADVCTALGMKKFRVERLAKDVISNHPPSNRRRFAASNICK